MAAVLRSNPSLRRLLGAWAQSCLGTYAGYVALLLLTVNHLHTWAVSVVLLAEFVPAVAFSSWFGMLADHYPRRVLIVTANLIQAAAWGGLVVSHTAAPIFALALLAGVGNAMQRPALRSALQTVSGPDSQFAAAVYDACRWGGITLGPAIAAGLFAIFSGVAVPLALNAASFVVAAGVMATVSIERPDGASDHQPARRSVRAGLKEAFAQPGIGALLACSAGAIVAGGLLNVCEPLLARNVLHGSGSDYALLVASYGVGMVVASGLVLRAGSVPPRTLIQRYIAGQALTAIGMTGSAIVGSVALAAITFAGTGYANSLLLVSETQLIQSRVPNSVQGRLFGVKDSLEGGCFIVSLLGAAPLVAFAGVRITLTTGAVICGLCTVGAVLSLRRRNAEPAASKRSLAA